MKIVLCVILIILGTAFQSIFPSIGFLGGLKLELLPGFVVFAAIQFGLKEAVALGAFAGLSHDAFSVGPFGMTAIAFVVSSLIISTTREVLDPDLPWVQMIAGALVAGLAAVMSCLVIGISGESILAIIVLMWMGAFVAPVICFFSQVVNRAVGVA